MQYIVKPDEIEKRSFEIITKELGDRKFPFELDPIIKRVIHTTADFEYADLLHFHNNPVETAKELLREGADIVSDTNMILNGINKAALTKIGIQKKCFMADQDVSEEAKTRKVTRAKVSMEKALRDLKNKIFVIGNAPTALYTLIEKIREGSTIPKLIIGVPVGFVGAAESKEALLKIDIPSIVVNGRKGGSTVAVAIVNAILYSIVKR